MENKSTETTKKPNIQEIVRIFLQYWGHNFVYQGSVGTVRKIDGLTHGWNILDGNNKDGRDSFRSDRCSILLKSLGEISDEDITEISKKLGFTETHGLCREAIEGILDDTELLDWNISQVLQLTDFLRSRGYALPYGKWSVKELEEFGIFKIISDGK